MPKRLRILFTIPNFDTAGSGKALLNIARGLDQEQFEPHIMCMHDKGAFFQVVKDSGIPIHLYPYTTEMKPYQKGVQQCWKISREFKRIKPDIIHSFHYSADYSEALAAKLAGIKWIFTKKNMNWRGSSANAWRLRSRLANAIAVQNTDMLSSFFPASKKTFLIPRGVNTREFAFDANLRDLRAEYGLPSTEKIIITVANLVPVKGVEILLQSFAELREMLQGWSLMIVGDDQNEYAQSLKAQCAENGLTNKVIFTGKLAEVKPVLQMADIFVLPTLNKGRREGSPVSMLEAMANGRYVIGSAVPGIKDQLQSFPELLFNAGSSESLSKRILEASEAKPEEREEKARMLCAHVNEHYPIEKEILKHQQMYLETR